MVVQILIRAKKILQNVVHFSELYDLCNKKLLLFLLLLLLILSSSLLLLLLLLLSLYFCLKKKKYIFTMIKMVTS